MSNEIIVIESNKLQAYGDREEVREITDRLMAMHPASGEVGVAGMRAVAQLALMSNANPLPTAGEIYVWVDRGRVVVDFGIAYYRRISKQKDTVIWIGGQEPRPMTQQERERYGVPDDALAGICRGFLLSEYERLLERGVPWQAAQEMLARTSIGIVEKGDTYNFKYKKPIPPPHGRTWQWVAEKRAERDFYRKMALVDTTLVDGIQKRAQRIMADLDTPGRADLPEGLPDMTEADWADVFDQDIHPDTYNQDTRPVDGEVIEVEDSRGEAAPEKQAERNPRERHPSGLAVGDSVTVAGENDEKPGTVIGFNGGGLVIVSVEGQELKLKAERLTLVDLA